MDGQPPRGLLLRFFWGHPSSTSRGGGTFRATRNNLIFSYLSNYSSDGFHRNTVYFSAYILSSLLQRKPKTAAFVA